METIGIRILCLAIGYLFGNIQTAYIVGRLNGIDIREKGSGNAGTTNTLRVLGKKAALISLIVDIGKGALAAGLGSIKGPTCAYICALAVLLGHILPAFYGFKGGKGVAAAFGAVLMVNWKLALIALAIAVVLTLITRRMSVGSIFAAAGMAVFSVFMEHGFWPYALVMAAIVIFKHRSNIQRLIKGEEPPLNFKK